MAAALAGLLFAAVPAGAAPVDQRVAAYEAPNVTLFDTEGRPVSLAALLNEPRPVVLEFFYTSCTTICGLQASALANAQAGLGPNVALVSITLDPDYDTPARLKAYAKNFRPRPNWRMLTGSRADILRVLTAFDARPYGDNKMLHKPYLYIHCAPDQAWLRLEGLMAGPQIVAEVHEAERHPPPRVSRGAALLQAAAHWFSS